MSKHRLTAFPYRVAEERSPLVSVVVAAYNVEAYIGQCLDSLVHQTLGDIEIIVVDDASTDGTLSVLAHFAREHANIRLVRHPRNQGLSAVRNTGMALARGTYLAFLDGDDWASPDMLSALTEKAESTDAELVMGEFQTFDNRTFRFGPYLDGSASLSGILDASQEPSLFKMHASAGKKLYRRSFLEQLGLKFNEEHLYEDVYFHFAVLLSARRVALLGRPIFFYRINRPGQITERTDGKVGSLFASFQANEALLSRQGASDEVWGSLLNCELFITEWVLQKINPDLRGLFLRDAAAHFAKLSPRVWKSFCRRESIGVIARLIRFRGGHDLKPATDRLPLNLRVRAAVAKYNLRVIPRLARKVVGKLVGYASQLRRLLPGFASSQGLGERLRRIEELQSQAISHSGRHPWDAGIPHARFYTIREQSVLLFDEPSHAGARAAARQMAEDLYLTQFVPFHPGDVVLDIGAHVGAFAISLALRFPRITVYAIEPDPGNFRLLERNIEANGIRNVVALHCAVGVPGQAILYRDCLNSARSTLDRRTATRSDYLTSDTVEIVSLSTLRESYGITSCRMVKVCAPGSTRDILEDLPDDGWIDFLSGFSTEEEWPAEEIRGVCNKVATGYHWRFRDGDAPDYPGVFHGGHASLRLLESRSSGLKESVL